MSNQLANPSHQGYTLVDIATEESPTTGDTLVETFRGNKASLESLKNTFKSLGALVSFSNANGDLWDLTVTIDINLANSALETPIDTFRWDDEYYTEDVYSNPRVSKPSSYPDIEGFPAPGQPGSVTAHQLAKIEGIVAEYQSNAKTSASPEKRQYVESWKALLEENTWAADVAFFRMRGITSYELKRPLLTRVRTYSTSYSQRQTIEAVPTVLTTATLVTRESFPDAIKNQMPADPPSEVTPPLTAWGWRIRSQSAEVIPARAKIQETTSWVFAAWPKTFYQHV